MRTELGETEFREAEYQRVREARRRLRRRDTLVLVAVVSWGVAFMVAVFLW